MSEDASRFLATRDFTQLKPTTLRTTPTLDLTLLGVGIVTVRLVTIATTYYSTVPTLGFKLKGKDNYP